MIKEKVEADTASVSGGRASLVLAVLVTLGTAGLFVLNEVHPHDPAKAPAARWVIITMLVLPLALIWGGGTIAVLSPKLGKRTGLVATAVLVLAYIGAEIISSRKMCASLEAMDAAAVQAAVDGPTQ